MALNIKPLSDRVLIEPVAAETKTASGIFIPDTAKENRKRNCCCSWGWHKRTHNDSENGDSVLYGKYSGTELKLEGKDYLIMRRRYSCNCLIPLLKLLD
jgi:chaperonin GroES